MALNKDSAEERILSISLSLFPAYRQETNRNNRIKRKGERFFHEKYRGPGESSRPSERGNIFFINGLRCGIRHRHRHRHRRLLPQCLPRQLPRQLLSPLSCRLQYLWLLRRLLLLLLLPAPPPALLHRLLAPSVLSLAREIEGTKTRPTRNRKQTQISNKPSRILSLLNLL